MNFFDWGKQMGKRVYEEREGEREEEWVKEGSKWDNDPWQRDRKRVREHSNLSYYTIKNEIVLYESLNYYY